LSVQDRISCSSQTDLSGQNQYITARTTRCLRRAYHVAVHQAGRAFHDIRRMHIPLDMLAAEKANTY
jgi:hypothetical protein